MWDHDVTDRERCGLRSIPLVSNALSNICSCLSPVRDVALLGRYSADLWADDVAPSGPVVPWAPVGPSVARAGPHAVGSDWSCVALLALP
jgi:hypothetical protein